MIDKEQQQRRAVERRTAHRAGNNLTSLGDVLSELVEKRISPRQARFGLIAEAWGQLLPDELYQHCRIIDISGGRLQVSVDSPSYMHELQLLSCELLEELSRDCPRAQVREIKFKAS
jgi:predicted nucleic acid-binding Zn ribbon protein